MAGRKQEGGRTEIGEEDRNEAGIRQERGRKEAGRRQEAVRKETGEEDRNEAGRRQ